MSLRLSTRLVCCSLILADFLPRPHLRSLWGCLICAPSLAFAVCCLWLAFLPSCAVLYLMLGSRYPGLLILFVSRSACVLVFSWLVFSLLFCVVCFGYRSPSPCAICLGLSCPVFIACLVCVSLSLSLVAFLAAFCRLRCVVWGVFSG